MIKDVFSTVLLHETQCEDCNNIFYFFEDTYNISLPLPNNQEQIDIYDCFEHFIMTEKVEGYYCKACKRVCSSRRNTKLWKKPKILILHLKKFKLGARNERQENKRQVDFPRSCHLKEYFHPHSRGNIVMDILIKTR